MVGQGVFSRLVVVADRRYLLHHQPGTKQVVNPKSVSRRAQPAVFP